MRRILRVKSKIKVEFDREAFRRNPISYEGTQIYVDASFVTKLLFKILEKFSNDIEVYIKKQTNKELKIKLIGNKDEIYKVINSISINEDFGPNFDLKVSWL